MSRTAITLGLGLAALLAIAAIAMWSYRASKLAILEPRALPIAHVKTGEATAGCTLLMIGDSHIARWPVAPPPGWQIDQVGFAGQSAINIAAILPAVLAARRPDAVLVAAGTNDASAAALQGVGREVTLDRAADAIEGMIAEAQAAGVQRIVVANLVAPRDPELWRRLIYGERQAAALVALSKKIEARGRKHGAVILDADALARDPGGAFRRDLRADALHWSPAGYDVLSKALWRDLGPCRKESA